MAKIKPDVILTWPSGFDYPLCRLQLTLFKGYFNRVIVAFYRHGEPNFIPFLASNCRNWIFVESPETGEAWRERAVSLALEKSESDHVLFTEQDFFWKDDNFLKQVLRAAATWDTVGIDQGQRLHPCFLLTKRELIEKTSKDFAVQGNDKDHFSKFTNELLGLGSFRALKDLGLFFDRDWYHFSSLTWNLFRLKDQNMREFHEPENFLIYNYLSRTKRVPQDKRWIAFTYFAETLLSSYGRFLNG